MPPILRLSIILLSLTYLTACSEDPPPAPPPTPAPTAQPEPKTPPMRPVTAAERSPAAPARLHASLPADAIGYVRLPSVWGVLGAAKGGIYDKAVGSAPYAEAVATIRKGFGENVLAEIPPDTRALWTLLMLHARSPIEAAFLPSSDPQAPVPNLLLGFTSDFENAQALSAFLTDAAASNPLVEVLAPIDANGSGLIGAVGFPVEIHFDASDRRLHLYASATPAPGTLAKVLAGLAPAPSHPMRAVEQRVDESGQGLFVWVDPPSVLRVLATMGQSGQAAMLEAFGAGQIEAIALGVGTSGGLHRAKLLVEMPRVGFRTMVPVMKSAIEVEAAGTPTTVVVLGLPAASDLTVLESTLLSTLPPEEMQEYVEGKRRIQEKLGFTVEEFLAAFGQDLTVISDDSGDYAALRIADAKRFEALLAAAIEKMGLKHEQRDIAGQSIHHLVLPPFVAAESDADDELPAIARRALELPSHVFWVREGDYLLLSGIPQTLIDRQYIESRRPVADWLANDQRMSAHGAMLLGSTTARGVPSFVYGLNLQLLLGLGDFVGAPIDLFAMPTPRELGLPENGSYGLKVASTESELMIELGFENNPGEILMAGGSAATGVAVVGILAAVAIPAYQDYTVKAAVHGAIASTAPLRAQIASFAADAGRFPNAEELSELDLSALASEHHEVAVEPDSGVISVTFDMTQLGEGEVVLLVPVLADGNVEWACESDLAVKFLPPQCR